MIKEKAELKKVEERRFEFHLMAEASRLKMIQVHMEKLKAKHMYQNWQMTNEQKIIK